jgi:hypothetical protein
VRHFNAVAGKVKAISKASHRMVAAGKRLHVVYEAGPCGFVLHTTPLTAANRRAAARWHAA